MESLMEKDGWIVVCESPFEIENVDGSVATGYATKIIEMSYEEDDAYDTLYKAVCIFFREAITLPDDFESDEEAIEYIKQYASNTYP